MPLFTSLTRAADMFRKVKALTFVLLQPLPSSAWFSGTIGIAVWHRPVSCCCSGSRARWWERAWLFANLVGEAVAALFIEEPYPFTRSSRKMKSFKIGKLTGLWRCFWFLKLYVPVLFNILNGFQKMKWVYLLLSWIASKKWILIVPCHIASESSESPFSLSSRQRNKNVNLHSFQEQSLRPVL